MDKFPEAYNLPRMNHEEIEYMNRTIISKDIVKVTKNLPKNKSPGPAISTGKFYKTFKEVLIIILLKLFQTMKRREHFLTQFTRLTLR